MLRKFCGGEVAQAVLDAVEAIPDGAEIVDLKAGENKPILCAFVVHDEAHDFNGNPVPEYAWDGRSWKEVGIV